MTRSMNPMSGPARPKRPKNEEDSTVDHLRTPKSPAHKRARANTDTTTEPSEPGLEPVSSPLSSLHTSPQDLKPDLPHLSGRAASTSPSVESLDSPATTFDDEAEVAHLEGDLLSFFTRRDLS